MKTAISPTRAENFPEWYQQVVAEADLAVNSPVRGCMIIRPNGYGIWERIQKLLNDRIMETGHENLYFPLFIPLSFFSKEAEHVEGFAKEMAVVTHHRLKMIDGELKPDPDAKLAEPLVVRPTSETIIGHHFRESVKSWRDLPLLWNQWANVVRWEMRTRLFLRTAEFLWQEGHTAHATAEEARAETMKMLGVYVDLCDNVLAMPTISGEKPAHERFPGAESTFSFEAMMQDGKALQAGTAHYLGTHFSKAQDIKYQNKEGGLDYCHTTSWGVTTRLIGGMIMTHGDDDGMRIPPRVAPRHVVILPIQRGAPEDEAVLAYCESLAAELRGQAYAGEPVRVFVDRKDERAVDKRWAWIKKGAPIICEIGGRDVASGNISFYRRDKLREGEKLAMNSLPCAQFIAGMSGLLAEVQAQLFADAKKRLDANIVKDVDSFDALKAYFAGKAGENEDSFRGWLLVPWKRPEGEAGETLLETLKQLKLTTRNVPFGQEGKPGKPCIFTGEPADEMVLIARSY